MERILMKIYHLVIAYNDETEELEYIEEYVENDKPAIVPYTESTVELDPDYWEDEELMSLIWQEGLAEA
tara:strand:+ start:721 stop:927 length:207 start_codon:yes stop_codon:yes gene_type:complete